MRNATDATSQDDAYNKKMADVPGQTPAAPDPNADEQDAHVEDVDGEDIGDNDDDVVGLDAGPNFGSFDGGQVGQIPLPEDPLLVWERFRLSDSKEA